MAKPLVFQWGDRLLAFDMNNVDRSKLYGDKDVEIVDDDERRCELATLAEDRPIVVCCGGQTVNRCGAAAGGRLP